jgi:hypothetical protein
LAAQVVAGSRPERRRRRRPLNRVGATTKTGPSGAAGGFGKAKELLLLPWIAWRVHSRDTLVEGVGIDYTVKRAPMRQGTRLDVVMPPDKLS